MKKLIIFLILFIPLLGWSQDTTLTKSISYEGKVTGECIKLSDSSVMYRVVYKEWHDGVLKLKQKVKVYLLLDELRQRKTDFYYTFRNDGYYTDNRRKYYNWVGRRVAKEIYTGNKRFFEWKQ
jgi:hypothetical protein